MPLCRQILTMPHQSSQQSQAHMPYLGLQIVKSITYYQLRMALILFFLVWEKANFDIDVAQGKNIANAAKQSGVQHLIWSSLPNITKGKTFISPLSLHL